MSNVDKARALINLACDESTSLEERSSAALQAARLIHTHGLELAEGEVFVFPEDTVVVARAAKTGSIRVRSLASSSWFHTLWVPRDVILKEVGPMDTRNGRLLLVVKRLWAKTVGLV